MRWAGSQTSPQGPGSLCDTTERVAELCSSSLPAPALGWTRSCGVWHQAAAVAPHSRWCEVLTASGLLPPRSGGGKMVWGPRMILSVQIYVSSFGWSNNSGSPLQASVFFLKRVVSALFFILNLILWAV